MRISSLDSLFAVYSEYWGTLQREFFKVETFQSYKASFEEPAFLAFRQGELDKARELLRQNLLRDPAAAYSKIRERGIAFRRVHIVDLPLTEYLKFEIESYRVSTELGEEISFALKDEVSKSALPAPLIDFLLFDDARLILHNYNASGEWNGAEVLTNGKEVSPYVALKGLLLDVAIPMEEFLRQHAKS